MILRPMSMIVGYPKGTGVDEIASYFDAFGI
jgi:hypothetical protein